MLNRVVHFEIQVADLARAMAFYKAVFGWEFQKWGDQDYWMIMTAPKDSKEPGINGGLLPRASSQLPSKEHEANAYVCTVQVDHYDEIEAKILAAGGAVSTPKYAFPGMAWQGYYFDSEGNVFGVHQADEHAK